MNCVAAFWGVLLPTLALGHSLSPHIVAGYLPEWRYLQWTTEEQQYRWKALSEYTTHLIIFSIEVDANGDLVALDRFPPPHILRHAHEAARMYDTKLLICFGGNSRTRGFPAMVASKTARQHFTTELIAFIKKHKLHGADLNWEYPRNEKDWRGLAQLIVELRAEFRPRDWVLSMAYYPDGGQERILKSLKIVDMVDMAHMMCYDQGGRHSTMSFTKDKCLHFTAQYLPPHKVTLGLPFYGRHIRTGEWITYEDIVKQRSRGSIDPSVDEVDSYYFNGVNTIREKTELAVKHKLGGVMIWELGQDNFDNAARGLTPTNSLLKAIADVYKPTTKQEL